LMKVGKVSSQYNEHIGTAVVDEQDKAQGPVPGNTEATPALHPRGQVPDPAIVGLSALPPTVRLPSLRVLVAFETLVCHEVQPASGRRTSNFCGRA